MSEDPPNEAGIAGKPVYGSRSATRMPEAGAASGVMVASPPSVAIVRGLSSSDDAHARLRNLDDERRPRRMRIDVVTRRAPDDAGVRPQRASGMLWADLNTSVGSYFCLTPIRNGTKLCVGLLQYALT